MLFVSNNQFLLIVFIYFNVHANMNIEINKKIDCFYLFQCISNNVHKLHTLNMNIMILDTETTGLPIVKRFGVYYNPKELQYYENSRMIELGYSIYSVDRIKMSDTCNLVKPDSFTITNQYIHGITHNVAETKGLPINTVLNLLNKDIDSIGAIVGHNIMFDITIILSECYRYGFLKLIDKILQKEIICTMKLGKQYLKIPRSPSLAVLYRTLFKKYILQNHRALDDVNLCAECYFHMV